MDNMKKQKQHRFTDKHPVASALLLVFGGYILFAVTDYVFSLIWGKLTEIKEKRPEIMEVWDKKWKISTEA